MTRHRFKIRHPDQQGRMMTAAIPSSWYRTEGWAALHPVREPGRQPLAIQRVSVQYSIRRRGHDRNRIVLGAGLEPDFPFEFIVPGTPVSFQRDNKDAKREWKELVRASGAASLPEMHFATKQRLAITLYYYPEDRMIGDVDNIVKLTLDAMCQQIYVDDEQVERVVVQKFERDRVFGFQDPSPTLAACMLGAKPALYVRISNDPHEDLTA